MGTKFKLIFVSCSYASQLAAFSLDKLIVMEVKSHDF